jgi:dolichol-phosphate mannosyltransferase
MEVMSTMHSQPSAPTLSVVIPCYNEEAVLPFLRERLIGALASLEVTWEVVFVNDGSRDSTLPLLIKIHNEDPRFKVLSFSRNFGHQAAVMAGISYASGDAVAILDADLQDPPELLAKCMDHWRDGYEVVYAVRQKRKESVFKRMAYGAFYRLLRTVADTEIPLDSGDFCLMDRQVVDVLRKMPERNVFVRGLRAWSGFKQIGLPYERPERAAGETKYPFKRLVKLALDGIFSFSTMPLRLTTWIGMGLVGLCFLGAIFIFVWRMFPFRILGHAASDVPGWTTGMIVMLFLSGIQFLILGAIGEYIARIYDEVKGRPRWIVARELGFGGNEYAPSPAPDRAVQPSGVLGDE